MKEYQFNRIVGLLFAIMGYLAYSTFAKVLDGALVLSLTTLSMYQQFTEE